jgi:uncharacterized protein (DUF58 family)
MGQVSRYLDPALVEQLNLLRMTARGMVEGARSGPHRSRIKGASVEFRQHRAYVPGDEPRRLDWRVLARTDRPFVREYDEETNLRCVVMVDCSGSMGYGREGQTKYDYAARLAAAFAYLLLGQTESVGMVMCAQGALEWVAPRGGAMQLAKVMDALEGSAPGGRSGMAEAMHEVAERMERRSVIIALSDFFEPVAPLRSGLAHLRHARHEVMALQIVDRHELDFPFKGWTRFRGMELEASRMCEPAMMRRIYRENFEKHRKSLKETFLACKSGLERMVTDRPVMDSVKTLLMSSWRRG